MFYQLNLKKDKNLNGFFIKLLLNLPIVFDYQFFYEFIFWHNKWWLCYNMFYVTYTPCKYWACLTSQDIDRNIHIHAQYYHKNRKIYQNAHTDILSYSAILSDILTSENICFYMNVFNLIKNNFCFTLKLLNNVIIKVNIGFLRHGVLDKMKRLIKP